MINKEKFRTHCIQRLKEFNRPNVYLLDKKVCNWLYFYIKKSRYRVVMLYIPLKIEINLSNFHKKTPNGWCYGFSSIYGR